MGDPCLRLQARLLDFYGACQRTILTSGCKSACLIFMVFPGCRRPDRVPDRLQQHVALQPETQTALRPAAIRDEERLQKAEGAHSVKIGNRDRLSSLEHKPLML